MASTPVAAQQRAPLACADFYGHANTAWLAQNPSGFAANLRRTIRNPNTPAHTAAAVRSVLGFLSLGVALGDTLEFIATGAEAEQALAAIAELVATTNAAS